MYEQNDTRYCWDNTSFAKLYTKCMAILDKLLQQIM